MNANCIAALVFDNLSHANSDLRRVCDQCVVIAAWDQCSVRAIASIGIHLLPDFDLVLPSGYGDATLSLSIDLCSRPPTSDSFDVPPGQPGVILTRVVQSSMQFDVMKWHAVRLGQPIERTHLLQEEQLQLGGRDSNETSSKPIPIP